MTTAEHPAIPSFRHDDLHFAVAPMSGKMRLAILWPPLLLLALNVGCALWLHFKMVESFNTFSFPAEVPFSWFYMRVLPSVAGVLAVGVLWYGLRIRELKLEGNMLLLRRLWWTHRIELTGLQSIEADPQAHKKRLGKMRGYVTDQRKAVVLRLADRCVVVSPRETEWFMESVRKRMEIL